MWIHLWMFITASIARKKCRRRQARSTCTAGCAWGSLLTAETQKRPSENFLPIWIIMERIQHLARGAIGGGFVGKIMVAVHVAGFELGQAGKLGVESQRGQSVSGPILIQQIQ